MSGLPSRFPYVFEPGMSVRVIDHASPVLVTLVDDRDRGMWASFQDARLYVSMHDCMADLDHPGTRGLLLQQYRDASGHAEAVVALGRAGEWHVIPEPYIDMYASAGDGESEGAAILDALTRLAAERARESAPAKSSDGSEAILQALLTETQTAVENLARRFDAVENALDNDRLARIEARLRRIEDGHV